MPNLSGDFDVPQLGGGMDGPGNLFPSEGAFNIGAVPSAYGSFVDVQKAEAARNLMKAQQERLPLANELAMGRMKGQIANLPEYNQLEKQKLVNEYSQLKGKPAGDLLDSVADLWPSMKDKDEITKARMYGALTKDWKTKHPGMELPPELENYNPETTDQHLENAYDMKRFSVEHEKEIEKARAQQATELEKARIAGTANIIAQRGRGAEAAAMKTNEDKKNTKRIGELKKGIADPKATDEQKETMARELESLAMSKFEEDQIKRFPETARAYMTPEAQKAFDDRSKQARNAYLDSHGLRLKMVKNGKTYMIPRSQYSAALKEGYTKGE